MERKDNRGRRLNVGESQRSNGMYQYRYQDIDNKRYTVYSWRLIPSDKVPAGKKSDISLREIEASIQESLAKLSSNRGYVLTLNDMFDSYLLRKRHKGRPLVHNTKSNYISMWNSHIRNDVLGNMKVANIMKPDVVAFYQQLKEENISYGTIKFYNKILSSVFNMALDDNLISKNPTVRAMDEVEGEQKRQEALSIEQQEDLLLYAKLNNKEMYRKMIFLIDTMCRISELAGLTWQDIDMKERMITIDHQLQFLKMESEDHMTFHITPTKSKKSRCIPMTEEVYQVLKELRKHYFILCKDYEVDGKRDFLFYTKTGRLLNESSFSCELTRLVKKYNETAKNKIERLTPHGLRHTGCTRNAECGMDIKVLQYLMGHSTTQITNDIYNHVNADRVKQELAKSAFMRRNNA